MAKSGCIYGPTSSFKTTAIAHLAHYIANKTGKATLLFSADGGGWAPCDEEVRAGMIRPYRCDTATIPLPIVRKVSQGYWPQNPEETDISKVRFSQVNWDEVGAIAVEGFTSIGTMFMRHAADKNLKTGEEGTSKFYQPINIDGTIQQEIFAGSSKGHYNFVQNQLYGMTMNLTSLPVEYVLFTGLEKKAEDDDRTTVYGVSVPGKAVTNQIPTWVGDLLHAQDYAVSRKVRVPPPGRKPEECKPEEFVDTDVVDTVCRYYFKKHPDPATGIMFPAKPRISHGAVRELEKRFPGGYFEPTPDEGFDRYLEVIDELSAGRGDSLRNWRAEADRKLGRGSQPVPKPAQAAVAVAVSK
jgi:hypothetical protein